MITIEDGTGNPGANSYATVDAFRAYHALRLNQAATAATDTGIVAALVRATDHIEATYRPSTPRLNANQALQWPVEGATAVPGAIVAATIILALYALSGPLNAPAERGTKRTRKKLEGVGELETEFDDIAPSDPYPAITSMLAGVATPRGAEMPAPGALIMGRLTR